MLPSRWSINRPELYVAGDSLTWARLMALCNATASSAAASSNASSVCLESGTASRSTCRPPQDVSPAARRTRPDRTGRFTRILMLCERGQSAEVAAGSLDRGPSGWSPGSRPSPLPSRSARTRGSALG